MNTNELKIGNFVEQGTVTAIFPNGIYCEGSDTLIPTKDIQPILLTEDWLKKFGFKAVENTMFINGREWLLQVTKNDYVDIEAGEIINRDGTWFGAIGTRSFKEDGAMAVDILCRGNYVCGSVETVHDLQNMYSMLRSKYTADEGILKLK